MRTIWTSLSLGPVAWFTPAVKSLYLTTLSENSPELHTCAHIKREPERPTYPPDCPPLPESVDLAESALTDEWTQQTSVFQSSELCAA